MAFLLQIYLLEQLGQASGNPSSPETIGYE